MGRDRKPSAIGIPTEPLGQQPTVSTHDEKNEVVIQLPTGESATVNLHGATVTSWNSADGAERLFLSEKAVFDGSKPIRGGIPICFPIFGPPREDHAPTAALPQHGFARNSRWELLGSTTESEEDEAGVRVDFGLSATMLDEATRGKWPYDFGLVYGVTLNKDTLRTNLQVQNKGSKPFQFQALLHTYFQVEDVTNVRVLNLKDATYADKVTGAAGVKETSSEIAVTGEIDRLYKSVDNNVPIVISQAATANSPAKPLFSIEREALGDVTVWNPWAQKAEAMADFAPKDAYTRMICVEPGSVAGWQELTEAGDLWKCSQTIRAL